MKPVINKFDKLAEFIKAQVAEKGSLVIAKEVEDLMVKKGLTYGPTLEEFIENPPYPIIEESNMSNYESPASRLRSTFAKLGQLWTLFVIPEVVYTNNGVTTMIKVTATYDEVTDDALFTVAELGALQLDGEDIITSKVERIATYNPEGVRQGVRNCLEFTMEYNDLENWITHMQEAVI